MKPGQRRLVLCGLLLVTAWFYAPSLHFGLMWDDPHWFGRAAGKSLPELLRPMPDFHFYRPMVMLYNSLFVQADGRLAVLPLHVAQVGWHLLNIALTYSLGRALQLRPAAAVAAAMLIAFHPYAYQAVAWAAPQQAMNMALLGGAWLAYIEARRQRKHWPLAAAVSLALFMMALFLQESSVILAFIPLLLELFRTDNFRWRNGHGRSWLALIYPLVAGAFAFVWLLAPRQPGYTILAMDARVSAYLLQGVVFPIFGRPSGYQTATAVSEGSVLTLATLSLLLVVILAWRTGHSRAALFCLTWAGLGLVLPAAGLSYEYVSIGPRLFYYAIPGVAILWACVLWPRNPPAWKTNGWRFVGGFLLLLIMTQSLLISKLLDNVYAAGTDHLNAMVASIRPEDERLIFINFPDRYALKQPPYPVGYWGVTLAPVVTDLGAFPVILTGAAPQTQSINMPWLDEAARNNAPYQVDMRGEITAPEQLYTMAREATAVYLSRYHLDGSFTLHRLGNIAAQTPPTHYCELAWFAGRLCLQSAAVARTNEVVEIKLDWLLLNAADPHETIFLHLGQMGHAPIAQADGAPWLDALPLFAWQPGDIVSELRTITLPPELASGDYLIWLGLYNWATNERAPATAPSGEPLPDDILIIGQIQWPP